MTTRQGVSLLLIALAILLATLAALIVVPERSPDAVFAVLGLLLLAAPLFLLASLVLLGVLVLGRLRSVKPPTAISGGTDPGTILVRSRATGEIVERVSIDGTAGDPGMAEQLTQLQGIAREFVERKYGKGGYDFAIMPGGPSFVMSASARSMITVNAAGIVTGVVLLALLLFIRTIFALTVFVAGSLLLVGYMIADFLISRKRGIRSVEVDHRGITVTRGSSRTRSFIERARVSEIGVYRKIGRCVVVVFLGGKPQNMAPGVTLFTGERLRLANDAFDDGDFARFLEALRTSGYPLTS